MKYWYDKDFKGVICEPDSAEEWMRQIWEVGCGYDGCETVEFLKSLVDELVEYSFKARDCLTGGKIFEDKEKSERSLIAAYAERDKDLGV